MKRVLSTVKMRVIFMILCFSMAITMLVVSFSYYLISVHQRNAHNQSIEFGLQLVSENIEQDLIEIMALASWCANGANPIARFLASPYDPAVAVQVFERLQHEEILYNRASDYINRVLVVSDNGPHLVHAGLRSNSSNLGFMDRRADVALAGYALKKGAHIYDIAPDPYDRVTMPVINILGPVYAPAKTYAVGRVYVAANTKLILNSLQGYTLPEGSRLYLQLGEDTYRIEDNSFIPASELGRINFENNSNGQRIATSQVEVEGAGTLDAISCRVRDGVILIQVYDSRALLPTLDSWVPMLAGIILLILLLSVTVIFMMNRTISQPVARIRRKVDAIAAGDFSQDPSIESDSEIGEVGQGINKLSKDVVALMESRVADEKQKRELEYRMLQSQVNPHFLYNTLGTIKWMATLQKAEGITEMTTALSRLLRTVSKDLRKEVTLREEFALLDDYYLILKYRYGGTVEFDKHLEDEALLECSIPRFVLQPLMENAIFHGIEPKGKGHIELYVAREGDAVEISIVDDGVGMRPEAIAALNEGSPPTPEDGLAHIGIRSVHYRVQNAFGSAYGLTAESKYGEYTKMILRIPYSAGEGVVNTVNEQE